MSERKTPALIGQGVQAIAETATRLGLTWQLRPASVAASTEASPVVSILLDGDTEPIDAVSLLGGWLQVGARVMVAAVPPSANFIVGYVLAGHVANRLTYDEFAMASSALSLGAAATLVPGMTLTVITTGIARYTATAFFDFDETVTGATVCIGELYLDSSVAGTQQALLEVTAATHRATVGQQWVGDLAAGSHTFEGRARRSAAAGTQFAGTPHSSLRVQIYE